MINVANQERITMKLKFKTKRLLLEVLTDEQIQSLIDRETDPHMQAAYAEMLSGSRAHPAERHWYAPWGIYQKDGAFAGDLCFKGPPSQGEVEIGYGIHEAFQGKGYATEAAGALTDWAFSQPDVYYVTAETEPDNQKSKRVLEKLGFKQYGEGAEGPRFEKEKAASNWLVIYLALGLGVGASFGASLGNIGLGTSIGLCLGVALGAALDAQEKKARDARRAARDAEKAANKP